SAPGRGPLVVRDGSGRGSALEPRLLRLQVRPAGGCGPRLGRALPAESVLGRGAPDADGSRGAGRRPRPREPGRRSLRRVRLRIPPLLPSALRARGEDLLDGG